MNKVRGSLLWFGLLLGPWGLAGQTAGDPLPPWSPGRLDIHQIQTGRGNSAFLIFPDGKTLLIDAGAVPERSGLEVALPRPNASRPPGEWIARYIQHFSPRQPAALDYALITHYHDDHMGGLAGVHRLVPIRVLLDRGDTPAAVPGSLMEGYRAFRNSFGGTHETLRPGRNDQITGGPDFEVRNVAANGEVWTGTGTQTRQVFPEGWERLPKADQPSENHFSAALRIRYGRFTYFSGGDIPGVPLDELPGWQDLETPVAQAIGRVDALVLDHHGWLDTTNAFFLKTLQPRVVVIPAWHATHPDHGVLRRLLSTRLYPGPRDLFLTSLLEAPKAVFSYLGAPPFASTEGHVVIRVMPGGTKYWVYTLADTDEAYRITGVHGPYEAR